MTKQWQYALWFGQGIIMGAADVIPGVSGGTMAFVMGIYPRFIHALAQFDRHTGQLLRQRQWRAAWQKIDGGFLLSLGAGIICAVLTLAKVLRFLLITHPISLWGFFFGLIFASIFHLARTIPRWRMGLILAAGAGFLIAAGLAFLPATNVAAPSLPYLFFCAMLAICAMILPGISGAFILVLLGAYPAVLGAVHNWQWMILFTLAGGALGGLLLFARLLNWLFVHYRLPLIAALTGFIAGSLLKVWPWKRAAMPVWPTHETLASGLVAILAGVIVVGGLSWWEQRAASAAKDTGQR